MSVSFDGSAGFITGSGATYDGLQRLTSKTASGVKVEFTGIPPWAKRITVMLQNVSTNGTSSATMQVGDISGFSSTTYYNTYGTITGTNTTNTSTSTTEIVILPVNTAADIFNIVIQLFNIQGNVWVISTSGTSSAVRARIGSGKVVLNNGELDRVLLTINGTEQFDAGSINIIYE